MFYKEYEPVDRLKNYIKCFWRLEHDYSKAPFTEGERIWPDGHFELIFSNGKKYFQKIGSKVQALPENLLIGQFNRELLLMSGGITRLHAVRFHAWGLYPFLRIPMNVFTNQITDSSTLYNGKFREIATNLKHEKIKNGIQTLQNLLADSISDSNHHKGVEPIAREIYKRKGIVVINQLAEAHNINPRKIQRQFEIEIGLSAKNFAKIVRFNHAKKIIEKDPHINLAEVAYICGYADQPHFTKNFKSLYGITPTKFKRMVFRFKAHQQKKDNTVVFVQDN